ncbi:MAG: calcium/sodium antiporter [Chloroflexaceae bacterium]
MAVWPLLLFIFGLGLLVLGGEVLVRGASRLAIAIGISPLVVGLTVVSFGTSSPELAVNVQSAWESQADIALGNVIGSNIFNVLVVLALCAIVVPLTVSRQLIRLDVPIMIGAAVLTLVLGFDGRIGRLDGLLLFVLLIAYLAFSIRQSRRESELTAHTTTDTTPTPDTTTSPTTENAHTTTDVPVNDAAPHSPSSSEGVPHEGYAVTATTDTHAVTETPAEGRIARLLRLVSNLGSLRRSADALSGTPSGNMLLNVALIVVGLVLLVLGSDWLVAGAVTIAGALGISELIIGLTIVAVGTSLPEVATSVVAAYRGQRDIAVGNVVGSSIFNILAILGLTALVSPAGIGVPAEAIWFNIPVMIAVSLACLPIFFTGSVVSRREGWMLLGYYGVYTIFLIWFDVLSTLVLVSFVIAPVGLLIRQDKYKISGWALAVLPLMLFTLLATRIPAVIDGEIFNATTAWAPNMGVALAFQLDGLSLLFTLIITGIGTLIVLYTNYYLAGDPGIGRFYLYLLIFMGSMLGVILANNILTMFIFWELTSASSYLLIGFKHEYERARWGAQQGLLITAGGGLGLLFGLLLLAEAARTVGVDPALMYNLDAIIAAGEDIKETGFYTPAVLLIFLGCFTKSAQFPFHFWLPNAMQAPTPASAFLHSATMVKAGVYLLARLNPGLGETLLWNVTLTIVGATTLLVSSILALRQNDLKALLAYSTISVLGVLTMLVGLGGEYAAKALVAYILAHALYKSALFMVAGTVDHEAGTRDLRNLGGLRRDMPISMWITVPVGLSMAGIPITMGFVAKEMVLKATTASPLPWVLTSAVLAVMVITAILAVAYTWRFFNGTFLGAHGSGMNEHVHEAPVGMLLGPGIPSVLTVLFCLGLLPAVSYFLSPAASQVAGEALEVHLHLWEGINLAFLLTLLIIAVGTVITRFEHQIVTARSPLPGWLNSDQIYDATINGLLSGTKKLTIRLQSGKLRYYLTVIVLAFLAIIGPTFLLFALDEIRIPALGDVMVHEVIAALLIPVGVLTVIRAPSRVGAIIAVGMVGAMVSLFFVFFSAPDLALTQLLIEVLLTVFLLLVFSVLPSGFAQFSSLQAHRRDSIIAVCVGVLMMGLTLVAATSNLFPSISPYYLAESLPGGKGANVVNVILVDFRSLDTLGEITVLFIAALGTYGLLRLRSRTPRSQDIPSGTEDAEDSYQPAATTDGHKAQPVPESVPAEPGSG